MTITGHGLRIRITPASAHLPVPALVARARELYPGWQILHAHRDAHWLVVDVEFDHPGI